MQKYCVVGLKKLNENLIELMGPEVYQNTRSRRKEEKRKTAAKILGFK